MITRLKIEKLFGRFDYDLDFDRPVTILTGPNGFGKSTVLRMIEALADGEYELLYNLEFNEINIGFSNWQKDQLLPIKKEGDDINVFGKTLPYTRIERVSVERVWDYLYENDIDIDEYSELTADEKKYIYSNVYSEADQKLIRALVLTGRKIGNVKLISEQRLLDLEGDENEEIEVVLQIPQRLKDEIDKADNEFAKVSAKEDPLLPKRINEGVEITEEQYKELQKQLNDRFDKLRLYNLKDEPTLSESFQEKTSASMNAVFITNINKYSAFDKLLGKLDLFVDVVNNRLLFKKLDISRSEGFKIVDTEKKDENDKPIVIPLDKLSSGEKQIIVMYYDLIFNDTNKNLLLLIDEPEISMHIVWQSKFIDDLIRIAEHSGFRAIVATHSPDIIDGKWDLQIDLGEQYQGNLYGEDEGEPDGN